MTHCGFVVTVSLRLRVGTLPGKSWNFVFSWKVLENPELLSKFLKFCQNSWKLLKNSWKMKNSKIFSIEFLFLYDLEALLLIEFAVRQWNFRNSKHNTCINKHILLSFSELFKIVLLENFWKKTLRNSGNFICRKCTNPVGYICSIMYQMM